MYCGGQGTGKFNGDWEYYLHIDNDSIVTFDTCSSYLNLFSMQIYVVNDSNYTLYSKCIECGSICLDQSKFRLEMAAGSYLMNIDQKHEFEMICEPVPNPTSEPSDPLTTDTPSVQPSAYPTGDPTTSYPTMHEVVVNVSFSEIQVSDSYLSDPFGRLESSITVIVTDDSDVLGDLSQCQSCFVWQYKSANKWTNFQIKDNNDISMSVTRSGDEYTSKLVVQSIRRLQSGSCVDDAVAKNHPFAEDAEYKLRLKLKSESNNYQLSQVSNEYNITTNSLPSGGVCIIQNVEELMPLDPYNLFCNFWNNQSNLEFNALIDGVSMSTAGFVQDARQLTGIAPSGNVSITVLVKEKNEYNAITCYPIIATFKSIEDVLNEVPENETSTKVVDSILDKIDNITSSESLSENPDVAVSIISVVEDMYQSNLTTQSESQQIVDDMVVNILETSVVVSYSNESSVNITGDAIITELATVSSITSNEDIVDSQTTTTQLVEEYLPDIFDAVDIFIDVSARNASDNVSSTQVQDALYSIGEQSQELISNLEATLVGTVNVINSNQATIDSVNSLTESLVDYATLAASKALAQSEVGETFNFEATEFSDNGTIISSKIVTALKFEADGKARAAPLCGSRKESIRLPATFMVERDGTFDCAFMASSRNNFVSKEDQNVNKEQRSDGIVTANIYGSGIPSTRRRLSEAVEHNTSSCFPYFITMSVSNASSFNLNVTLRESGEFPSCDFWNINHSYWNTEGCFVYDITNDSVICGCTHLTTFSVSADEIWPRPNLLTDIHWRNLTIDNLLTYPTVWITCLCIFIVILIVCVVNPRHREIHTKSVIAFQDIIFKSTQDEKLWKDVSGKEIKYYSDHVANHHLLGRGLKKQLKFKEDRKSMMSLTYKLFWLYLRNDHTVLSLFQRTAGTNYSVKQRMACFGVYICTIMVATGMYYEMESTNIWADIIASFIASIVATTPGFIIRRMFEYSKPREEPLTKQMSLRSIQSGSEGVTSSRSPSCEVNQTVVEMREKFYEWMFPVSYILPKFP